MPQHPVSLSTVTLPRDNMQWGTPRVLNMPVTSAVLESEYLISSVLNNTIMHSLVYFLIHLVVVLGLFVNNSWSIPVCAHAYFVGSASHRQTDTKLSGCSRYCGLAQAHPNDVAKSCMALEKVWCLSVYDLSVIN